MKFTALRNVLPLLLALLFVAGPKEVFAGGDAKKKSKKSKEKILLVEITTPHGNMVVMLHNSTPQHRDNFVKLAGEGFYDGTLFHRVIKDFMIQGGDPDSKEAEPGQALGMGGPGYTVPAEMTTDLIHQKGALSAARLGDQVNPEKASSGSQFYIVQGQTYQSGSLAGFESRRGTPYTDAQKTTYAEVGGTPHLDMGYTVFGQVISGMEVIDKIAAVSKDPRDRPNEDISMSMTVLKPMKLKKFEKTYGL